MARRSASLGRILNMGDAPMMYDSFALAWFTLGPIAVLCLQYGWDMFVDDVVPVKED